MTAVDAGVDGGPDAGSPAPAPPDRPFGSRYLLGEVIGRGATGRVHRATVRDTGEPVAIKILRDDLGSRPEAVATFVQERTLLSALDDPHIVRVHDLVVEGDEFGIVMDLVTGGDLRKAVPMPCSAGLAVELATQIADGLACAHAGGVVHRDLKPDNVLVERVGEDHLLRLTDFGLARVIGNSTTTQVTSVAGTPGYLAPEVAHGRKAGPAADVYALGIMLYELCTGRGPFIADNPLALLLAHTRDEVPRPDGMSEPIWQLISRLLAKNPDRRPDAGQVGAFLREIAAAPDVVPDGLTATAEDAGSESPTRDGLPAAEPVRPSPTPPPFAVAALAAAVPEPPEPPVGRRTWRGRRGVQLLGAVAAAGVIGFGSMLALSASSAGTHAAIGGPSRTSTTPALDTTVGATATTGSTPTVTAPGSTTPGSTAPGSTTPGGIATGPPVGGAAPTGLQPVNRAAAVPGSIPKATAGRTVPVPTGTIRPGVTPSVSAGATAVVGSTPEPSAAPAEAPAVPVVDRYTPSTTREGPSSGYVVLAVTGVKANAGVIDSITVHGSSGITVNVPVDGNADHYYDIKVANLVNGRSYAFVATVCNSVGKCSSSASFSFTPYDLPEPGQVTATASATTVQVSWAFMHTNYYPYTMACHISVTGSPTDPDAPRKDYGTGPGEWTFVGKPGTTYTVANVCTNGRYTVASSTTVTTAAA